MQQLQQCNILQLWGIATYNILLLWSIETCNIIEPLALFEIYHKL